MATWDDAYNGIVALLEYCGEDPNREGLQKTPTRVLKMFAEITAGYQQDPKQILSTTFEQKFDELVCLRNVRFASTCEHHLASFTGFVTVGYLPKKRVVGLSKLARLVECFSKRLTIQERLTQQISEALMEHLDCHGAACLIEGRHNCMCTRGVLKPEASMVTSCLLGAFRKDAKLRAEFFAVANNRNQL